MGKQQTTQQSSLISEKTQHSDIPTGTTQTIIAHFTFRHSDWNNTPTIIAHLIVLNSTQRSSQQSSLASTATTTNVLGSYTKPNIVE